MQPGPKKLPRDVKRQRGTLQKCRDGVDTVERPAPAIAVAIVIRPPELPLEVADIWAEYHDHAVTNGARQADADTFAEWCSMTAILRKARNVEILDEGAGEILEEQPHGGALRRLLGTEPRPAPASYVQQWRQLGELLGLAGAKSRVGGASSDKKPNDNPFARNGRR